MSPALTKGWQTRPVHVTVLILSVDEAHLLERSLPAALAQEPRPDVVVIDNASADATAELVRRHAARHREAWALRHRACRRRRLVQERRRRSAPLGLRAPA